MGSSPVSVASLLRGGLSLRGGVGLDVVERMCTRIVIINNGRQIADGTADAIRAETGSATLEEAFSHLTGVRDVVRLASEFISALERV